MIDPNHLDYKAQIRPDGYNNNNSNHNAAETETNDQRNVNANNNNNNINSGSSKQQQQLVGDESFIPLAGSVYLISSTVDADIAEHTPYATAAAVVAPAAVAVGQQERHRIPLVVPPPRINAKNTVGSYQIDNNNGARLEASDTNAAAAAALGPQSLTLQRNTDPNLSRSNDHADADAVGQFNIQSKPPTTLNGQQGSKRVRCIWIGGVAAVALIVAVIVVVVVVGGSGQRGDKNSVNLAGTNSNTTNSSNLIPQQPQPAPSSPPAVLVQIMDPEIQLVAPDGAAGDGFGVSVALSGDVLVVGAHLADGGDAATNATTSLTNHGSAYVYLLAVDGTSWSLQSRLMPSDSTKNHYFGISVAVDGDIMVIGADGDDGNNTTNSGSAYVFINLFDGWTEVTKLTASDGAASDYFGNSLAISSDTIVVGAWNGDNSVNRESITGKAYVYTRSSDGDRWTEQVILTASDGATGDYFGVSVAIVIDTIVVGAQKRDGGGGINSGCAYVYTRSSSSEASVVWTEQTILTASDSAKGDFFGVTVAMNQDTIVVGADHADDAAVGHNNSGSAYVYTRSSLTSSSQGGSSWTEQAKLTASDASTASYFGDSVAVEGDVIVVGADQLDAEVESVGGGSGRAYVYALVGGLWTEQAILTASDAAPYDGFGESLAISGGSIVVGADERNLKQGSVYIF